MQLRNNELTPSKHFFHDWQKAVAGDYGAEEYFVFEFDPRHVEKVVYAVGHFELFCKGGGVFVFDRVFALQSSGEIHRHEPAGDIAGKAEGAADRPEGLFTRPSGLCIELLEPLADTPAVVPFLGLDLFYLGLFWRFL